MSYLRQNKLTVALILIAVLSATILAFPKSIAWLPEDLGKELWNLAHDTIHYTILTLAVLVRNSAPKVEK